MTDVSGHQTRILTHLCKETYMSATKFQRKSVMRGNSLPASPYNGKSLKSAIANLIFLSNLPLSSM